MDFWFSFLVCCGQTFDKLLPTVSTFCLAVPGLRSGTAQVIMWRFIGASLLVLWLSLSVAMPLSVTGSEGDHESGGGFGSNTRGDGHR